MSYTDFIYLNLCALREWKALLLEKEIMYTDFLNGKMCKSIAIKSVFWKGNTRIAIKLQILSQKVQEVRDFGRPFGIQNRSYTCLHVCVIAIPHFREILHNLKAVGLNYSREV